MTGKSSKAGGQKIAGKSKSKAIPTVTMESFEARRPAGRGKSEGSRATQFKPIDDGLESHVSRVTGDKSALVWWGALNSVERGALVAQLYQATQQGGAAPVKTRKTRDKEDQE